MRTMHGIFDVNNDGVISFDDFNILADKFGSKATAVDRKKLFLNFLYFFAGDLGHLSEKEMEDFRAVMKVIIESLNANLALN